MTVLVAATGLHAIWFTLRACQFNGEAEHFINRLALLLFFSGFTIYLQSWIVFLYATWPGSGTRLHTRRKLIYSVNGALNAVVWIIVFALSIAYFWGGRGSDDVSHSCDKCYYAGILLIAFTCFVLAAGYLLFGLTLYCSLQKIVNHSNGKCVEMRRAMRKVLFVGIVCTVFFALRCIFWMWEPVTGNYSPEGTYPWLFYTVVELVPMLSLLITIAPTQKKSKIKIRQKGKHAYGTVRGNFRPEFKSSSPKVGGSENRTSTKDGHALRCTASGLITQ
eukprot:CAMPEP_0114510484 /NCGR_PEP_ID=MMETSP0109-20121206/13821_1 /TAXON_ID=29199 /ORGANISM="Chlorarachnion reptans, Strain CCCM449" /LENGTH=276 /DNA_ID=CAMNT_0001689813 /DNA_START=496 /DNA_END=1329 /DNA_ORIENTATION=+